MLGNALYNYRKGTDSLHHSNEVFLQEMSCDTTLFSTPSHHKDLRVHVTSSGEKHIPQETFATFCHVSVTLQIRFPICKSPCTGVLRTFICLIFQLISLS